MVLVNLPKKKIITQYTIVPFDSNDFIKLLLLYVFGVIRFYLCVGYIVSRHQNTWIKISKKIYSQTLSKAHANTRIPGYVFANIFIPEIKVKHFVI